MSQQIHFLQQFSLKREKILNQIRVKIIHFTKHRYHLNKLLDFIFFFSTGCLLADDIQSGSLRLVLLLPMAEAFWELSSGFSSVCKSKSWENKINILICITMGDDNWGLKKGLTCVFSLKQMEEIYMY